MNIGLWSIEAGKPARLQRGSVNLERELEDWIELNPSFLQNGLKIVGRQMQLDAGRLDLLGLDPFGNWVIVEIKRGNVRRETVVQAIDYAACVSEMPKNELLGKIENYLKPKGLNFQTFLASQFDLDTLFEDRPIHIFVVGTGRDHDLERMTRFLQGTGSQISVVNFEVFESTDGKLMILRELTDLDANDQKTGNADGDVLVDQTGINVSNSEIKRLFGLAEQNGVGDQFREIYYGATALGLYPRTYKWSIMYTPPTNKTRVLICTWVKPYKKLLDLYIASQAIPEFYPVSENTVLDIIGSEGRYGFDLGVTREFVDALKKLFSEINKNM